MKVAIIINVNGTENINDLDIDQIPIVFSKSNSMFNATSDLILRKVPDEIYPTESTNNPIDISYINGYNTCRIELLGETE